MFAKIGVQNSRKLAVILLVEYSRKNMKNLITAIVILCSITSSCKQVHKSESGHGSVDMGESIEDAKSGTDEKFPTIGFRKVHEEVIPFSIEKVFPLFEPNGRHLLYDNWKPTILMEGKEGSIIGQIEFSKYDDLDVMLKVTKHSPEKGHIQYLAIWDDFEIQRIDIFCKEGIAKNTTEMKWIEHNAGLYDKGVSLVSKFVTEGYLVEAVERYSSNIEKELNKE